MGSELHAQSEKMKCPKCGAKMKNVLLFPVTGKQCPKCGYTIEEGMWLK